MQKFLLLAILTGLAARGIGLAAVEAESTNSSQATQELTPDEMRADFDLMRHALEEAHPGLYRYSTKAEMNRGFDAERARLGHAMPKDEFEVVLAETLALVRCGHTSMNPDDDFKAAAREARTF